jgi:hypothetical protein
LKNSGSQSVGFGPGLANAPNGGDGSGKKFYDIMKSRN